MKAIKLEAPLKDYLWGGERLKSEYGKETEQKKVAESWELSCHKDGNSVVKAGEYAGKTLEEYIKIKGKEILGKRAKEFANFPILIKLIDAHDNLSVQVHPKNEYAQAVEGEYGKTEMWYIVDCDEGAKLLYGFEREITKEEFENRIKENTLLEVTKSVDVKKGDVFFIEAGTLHAIGSGILIAEIQQNSNTTYRIYDYGRVGADGSPRELHIKKALDVTELVPVKKPEESPTIKCNGYTKKLLSTCEYFTVEVLDVETAANFTIDDSSFCSLLCLDGDFSMINAKNNQEKLNFTKGDSIFIEANFGECIISGKGAIIKTTI